WPRDWSSDVCSSDLTQGFLSSRSKPVDLRRTRCASCQTSALRWDCGTTGKTRLTTAEILLPGSPLHLRPAGGPCYVPEPGSSTRSEERRVGKEWSWR